MATKRPTVQPIIPEEAQAIEVPQEQPVTTQAPPAEVPQYAPPSDPGPTFTTEPESVVARVMRMTEELKGLRESAATQALKEIGERITLLNTLGFNYTLTDNPEVEEPSWVPPVARKTPVSGNGAPAPRGKTRGGKPLAGYDPAKWCPLCEVYGHDKRTHRNHPAKFSRQELAKLGLSPQ